MRDGVNMDAGSLDVSAGKQRRRPRAVPGRSDLVRRSTSRWCAVQDAEADATVNGTVEAFVGAANGRTRGGAPVKLDVSGPVDVTPARTSTPIANTDGGGGSLVVSDLVRSRPPTPAAPPAPTPATG